jgi:hypothetical protein
MEWDERLDVIEHASELLSDDILTIEEFLYVKRVVLDIPKQEEEEEEELFGSNTIVEKDELDGEITNKPVKKFNTDFERINVQEE